jgi:hypothetical protein
LEVEKCCSAAVNKRIAHSAESIALKHVLLCSRHAVRKMHREFNNNVGSQVREQGVRNAKLGTRNL